MGICENMCPNLTCTCFTSKCETQGKSKITNHHEHFRPSDRKNGCDTLKTSGHQQRWPQPLPGAILIPPALLVAADLGYPYETCKRHWLQVMQEIYRRESVNFEVNIEHIINLAEVQVILINHHYCGNPWLWLTKPINLGMNAYKLILIFLFHLTWSGFPFPESNPISHLILCSFE